MAKPLASPGAGEHEWLTKCSRSSCDRKHPPERFGAYLKLNNGNLEVYLDFVNDSVAWCEDEMRCYGLTAKYLHQALVALWHEAQQAAAHKLQIELIDLNERQRASIFNQARLLVLNAVNKWVAGTHHVPDLMTRFDYSTQHASYKEIKRSRLPANFFDNEPVFVYLDGGCKFKRIPQIQLPSDATANGSSPFEPFDDRIHTQQTYDLRNLQRQYDVNHANSDVELGLARISGSKLPSVPPAYRPVDPYPNHGQSSQSSSGVSPAIPGGRYDWAYDHERWLAAQRNDVETDPILFPPPTSTITPLERIAIGQVLKSQKKKATKPSPSAQQGASGRSSQPGEQAQISGKVTKATANHDWENKLRDNAATDKLDVAHTVNDGTPSTCRKRRLGSYPDSDSRKAKTQAIVDLHGQPSRSVGFEKEPATSGKPEGASQPKQAALDLKQHANGNRASATRHVRNDASEVVHHDGDHELGPDTPVVSLGLQQNASDDGKSPVPQNVNTAADSHHPATSADPPHSAVAARTLKGSSKANPIEIDSDDEHPATNTGRGPPPVSDEQEAHVGLVPSTEEHPPDSSDEHSAGADVDMEAGQTSGLSVPGIQPSVESPGTANTGSHKVREYNTKELDVADVLANLSKQGSHLQASNAEDGPTQSKARQNVVAPQAAVVPDATAATRTDAAIETDRRDDDTKEQLPPQASLNQHSRNQQPRAQPPPVVTWSIAPQRPIAAQHDQTQPAGRAQGSITVGAVDKRYNSSIRHQVQRNLQHGRQQAVPQSNVATYASQLQSTLRRTYQQVAPAADRHGEQQAALLAQSNVVTHASQLQSDLDRQQVGSPANPQGQQAAPCDQSNVATRASRRKPDPERAYREQVGPPRSATIQSNGATHARRLQSDPKRARRQQVGPPTNPQGQPTTQPATIQPQGPNRLSGLSAAATMARPRMAAGNAAGIGPDHRAQQALPRSLAEAANQVAGRPIDYGISIVGNAPGFNGGGDPRPDAPRLYSPTITQAYRLINMPSVGDPLLNISTHVQALHYTGTIAKQYLDMIQHMIPPMVFDTYVARIDRIHADANGY